MKKATILSILLFIAFLTTISSAQVYEAWVARYYGPGGGLDEAYALAVDDSGNVYVTGRSGIFPDYATFKYSPAGDTVWLRRYNSPGNNWDEANALAVDDSGNVYVTGMVDLDCDYLCTGGDYGTIKYAPNGETLWVRRYNGSGDDNDEAAALAVDDGGNVYVTGRSFGSGTDYDYATIKYSPAGDTLWVRRYNGPGSGHDDANALAVDDSGNVYVTGKSFGAGSDYDYATVKYSPAGDTLWARRYNETGISNDEATALAVDKSGNLSVTGTSFGDYVTIKYSPAGDTVWVRRYNGSGNGDDRAYALTVDDSGNVYVTGESYGSGINYDYATIKYSPAGDTLWVRRYNGPGSGHDEAYALAVDDSGNVYVTGESRGIGTWYDYATIKYSAAGDSMWVRRYNATVNSIDEALALAVDDSGNVYVTGRSEGSRTSYDYATIKYSPCFRSGNLTGDDKVNMTDVVYLVNIVLKSWAIPGPNCLADVNGDSLLSLADVIFLANYVLKFGPSPVVSGACCLAVP